MDFTKSHAEEVWKYSLNVSLNTDSKDDHEQSVENLEWTIKPQKVSFAT